jgi:Ca2+-transporting ATPase
MANARAGVGPAPAGGPPDSTAENDLEVDLTFVGMVGMIDPPRSEVREAVASAARRVSAP